MLQVALSEDSPNKPTVALPPAASPPSTRPGVRDQALGRITRRGFLPIVPCIPVLGFCTGSDDARISNLSAVELSAEIVAAKGALRREDVFYLIQIANHIRITISLLTNTEHTPAQTMSLAVALWRRQMRCLECHHEQDSAVASVRLTVFELVDALESATARSPGKSLSPATAIISRLDRWELSAIKHRASRLEERLRHSS